MDDGLMKKQADRLGRFIGKIINSELLIRKN